MPHALREILWSATSRPESSHLSTLPSNGKISDRSRISSESHSGLLLAPRGRFYSTTESKKLSRLSAQFLSDLRPPGYFWPLLARFPVGLNNQSLKRASSRLKRLFLQKRSHKTLDFVFIPSSYVLTELYRFGKFPRSCPCPNGRASYFITICNCPIRDPSGEALFPVVWLHSAKSCPI